MHILGFSAITVNLQQQPVTNISYEWVCVPLISFSKMVDGSAFNSVKLAGFYAKNILFFAFKCKMYSI